MAQYIIGYSESIGTAAGTHQGCQPKASELQTQDLQNCKPPSYFSDAFKSRYDDGLRAGGGTRLDKAHLAHCLFVVVVHLADQGVAEVHGDALNGLVLPRRLQDAQEELVDPPVLELQLLGDAEVTQCQAAVPLDLGRRYQTRRWQNKINASG